jgi:holliday junction resolvase Hjr
MNKKAKGTNAERELIHQFFANKWVAIRSAGSGCMQNPSPDILAGNNLRRLAIECKAVNDTKKYFTGKEIEELVFFANSFGAEPWVAIRFDRVDWFFLNVEDLQKTSKSYFVDVKMAKDKGLSFGQLIGNSALNMYDTRGI